MHLCLALVISQLIARLQIPLRVDATISEMREKEYSGMSGRMHI